MSARAQMVLMAGSTAGADGNDSFTELLLHCDGADASTTFTDSSSNGFTVTANGNAQVDTAQSKFGGASLLLDGTGDYLSLTDQAVHEVGAQDFTVDLWIRFNTIPGSGSLAQYDIFRKGSTVSSSFSFRFALIDSGGTRQLVFQSSTDGTTATHQLLRDWTPSTATWYHLALARGSGTVRIFIDGVQQGADDTDSSAYFNGTVGVTVGASPTPSSYMDGWMDEVRFSVGVARWTAGFTPPTVAYS